MLILQWVTPTQIGAFKEWIIAPVVGAAVWAFLMAAITSSRNKIHVMVTDNANRMRDEIATHMDAKFAEHEKAAFVRLDSMEVRMETFAKEITRIQLDLTYLADILRTRKRP